MRALQRPWLGCSAPSSSSASALTENLHSWSRAPAACTFGDSSGERSRATSGSTARSMKITARLALLMEAQRPSIPAAACCVCSLLSCSAISMHRAAAGVSSTERIAPTVSRSVAPHDEKRSTGRLDAFWENSAAALRAFCGMFRGEMWGKRCASEFEGEESRKELGRRMSLQKWVAARGPRAPARCGRGCCRACRACRSWRRRRRGRPPRAAAGARSHQPPRASR